MTSTLKTYDQLVELLYAFDTKLLEQFGEEFKVTIQAVGGFALMFHGFLPDRFKNNLVFVDSKFKFKCINLQIAVLESLMAMKLHAIDNMTKRGYDRHTNPRIQDPSDVKEILRLYNVKNEQDFVREFPELDCYVTTNIFDEYKLFE